MPLFMDRHNMAGASPAEVAEAHWCDLEIEAKHHVRFLTYWHHHGSPTGFCLVEAPSAEAVTAVHREAHEGVPTEIVEVEWNAVQAFLGPIHEPLPRQSWEDVATRSMLCLAMAEAPRPRTGSRPATALHAQTALARKTIGARGGRHVGGDVASVIGCFPSGAAAIECALALHASVLPMASMFQREVAQLRIGIRMGEPVDGRFGLFGAALKVATVLCDGAEPGATVVSGDVCSASPGSFEFTELGDVAVDGTDAPVTRFRLNGRTGPARGPLAARVSPELEIAPNGLTPRELDVLRMVAVGKTNKEIANDLCISVSTVATHVRNVFAKASVSNRAEAASFAYRRRLL
jgi:DNA-binding CsgD family transcriptional regulator/class 3 adenylate cyclase